jgi:hypothetical protein
MCKERNLELMNTCLQSGRGLFNLCGQLTTLPHDVNEGKRKKPNRETGSRTPATSRLLCSPLLRLLGNLLGIALSKQWHLLDAMHQGQSHQTQPSTGPRRRHSLSGVDSQHWSFTVESSLTSRPFIFLSARSSSACSLHAGLPCVVFALCTKNCHTAFRASFFSSSYLSEA